MYIKEKKVLVLEADSKRIVTFVEFLGRHKLTITDNADEAIKYLILQEYDFIFLNKDGLSVALFIEAYLNYEPTIVVHTIDTLIGEAIRSLLPYVKLLKYNTEEFYSVGEELW